MPTFGALKEAGRTHVLHVLGADCSDRPKRYPVPLFTPEDEATRTRGNPSGCREANRATVFLAYYRALTRAHALLRDEGSKGGIGFIQIAAGVFRGDQPSCARMFALALRAWAVNAATEFSETASGGVHQVTHVLRGHRSARRARRRTSARRRGRPSFADPVRTVIPQQPSSLVAGTSAAHSSYHEFVALRHQDEEHGV